MYLPGGHGVPFYERGGGEGEEEGGDDREGGRDGWERGRERKERERVREGEREKTRQRPVKFSSHLCLSLNFSLSSFPFLAFSFLPLHLY